MLKSFMVQDAEISCWINPEGFETDRKNLVFIHGSGSTSSVWAYQYAKLHKQYNIAAVNMPGHGRSSGQGEKDVRQYVRHLKDILEALAMDHPVLVGHSLGAATALSYAAHYPSAVRGVVSVGGAMHIPVNPAILEGLQTNPDGAKDLIAKISISGVNRPRLLTSIRASLDEVRTEVLAGDLTACNQLNLFDEIKKVIAPTLVICGKDDKMTPPERSEEIASAIAGAKWVLIEDAGHMVMMEKPDEVNEALAAFCASIA